VKFLVTGGAGFIGSALCRHLCDDDDAQVLNVDKLSYAGNLSSVAPLQGRANYTFVQADICDGERINSLFSQFRPDIVLHLAAETHVDRAIDHPRIFVETNVVGTFNLLEAARAHWDRHRDFRFITVSTDEVFGSEASAAFTEASAYKPSSPYSATKAGADHLTRAWGHTYGLPIIVSGSSNNYGPYQFPEKLIPLTILAAIEGKRLPVYGDGMHVRDWLHVDDHARALALIAQRGQPGETYLVGAGNERANIEIVRAICAIMDELRPAFAPHDRLIEFVADRPGHDRRYAVESSKLRRELDWRPQTDFGRGLRETVQWYIEHESWWRPLRQAYDGARLGMLES
jgi:dTDP-glucose 4,6-dehydratase